MSSKPLLLLISLALLSPDCFGDPISKAIKSLEKGKHEKVETLLNKSLEKYSINPGARYAYSLLYFDSTYTNYNLDSAHRFIEQALLDEQVPDSIDQLLPLGKADLTIDHLQEHKASVDMTAFGRAVEQNTVESFQYFIDQYGTSAQLANAISRRDQLAFEIASAENTYSSYKEFLDLYPDAYQAPMARERYDKLVFQAKTGNGKLQHFISFLREHPDTPYRGQAEWQIFQLETLDHQPESYQRFKHEYPESRYTRVADNILYHLDKEKFMSGVNLPDSIKKVHELESSALIPVFENDRYGFIDRFGADRIPPTFDSIPDHYLCQLLSEDVLQAFVSDKLVLMGRNQKILWDQPYRQVTDLGNGILEINVGDKYGILHKSGWQILEVEYEEIELLGGTFLAVKKNGKWGISSMTGRIIISPQFEAVENQGAFLLLKNGYWGVSNKSHLIQSFETDSKLTFEYEDWELVSHDYLMVFVRDEEGLINKDLQPVIPLSEHEIHELDTAEWFVKTAHGTIRFYGDQLQAIPPDRYQDYASNHHFIGLLKTQVWEVWDRASLSPVSETSYDSVAALGPHLMILTKDDKSSVLFRNGATIDLANNDRVRLIRDADQSRGFLQVTSNGGGKRQIYDLDGNAVYETWYYEVNPLTPQLFIIERNGLKGIVNLQGEILIKPRYQTIVADSLSHISLLHNRQFGYFNPGSGALIRPQYESRMIYFDENMLLTRSKGKMGLVDHKNKTLLPFEYDEIKHWADSSVWARQGTNWQVLNLFNREVEFDHISGLDWISGEESQKAIVKSEDGYGLLDSRQGMVLNPGFNDIINLGTAREPVFFTEKYIPEADYYVVIYYNQDMEVIRKQVFNSGNYDQVYCF